MDLHPDYLNRVRQAAIKALSLGLIYLSERKSGIQKRSFLYFLWLPKGKEEGYRTGHLCSFCGFQRKRKRGTGQVIFVLSVVTKGKGRGVQDRSSLYFLFFLPKGKEEGYRAGHLCTFCSCPREKKRGTGQVIFVLSVVTKRKRKRGTGHVLFVLFVVRTLGTGQLIFVFSVITKGKGREIQDRSSLYFLWFANRKEERYSTGHLLYFLRLPKGKDSGYRTGHLCTFCSYQRENHTFPFLLKILFLFLSTYCIFIPSGKKFINS
jgi:uncharacterized protein (DUF3820 family)